LESEFQDLGYKYSRKRGFRVLGDQIGIEEVAQPLVAFYGRFQDANRGKNLIFDRKPLYNQAFSGKKARHILLIYALARAIDERRIELKNKSTAGSIITIEEEQLRLLRNLKFKYFLVAVIASVIETIVGKKLNKETVAWSTETVKTKKLSIIDLTATWSPIVESVITFLTTQVDSRTLGDRISEEGSLESISKSVGALLYSNRNNPSFQAFALMVSDS
jgi:hypothetical protein